MGRHAMDMIQQHNKVMAINACPTQLKYNFLFLNINFLLRNI